MSSFPQTVKETATLTTENSNIEINSPGATTPLTVAPTRFHGIHEIHEGLPHFSFTYIAQRKPNQPEGTVQALDSGSITTKKSTQQLRVSGLSSHELLTGSPNEPSQSLRNASVGPKSEDIASVTSSGDGSKYLIVFPKILAHLVGQEDSYKTLFNASLVCKTLSSAALDALWQILPGIEPLLSLLPLTRLFNQWSYNASPPIFDWITFHAYSSRVQALRIKRLLLPMSDAVLMTLPQVHPGALLPNLNALHINENKVFTPGTLNPLLAFLPSSLSQLSLGISIDSARATTEFLMAINLTPTRHTENITNLRISMAFSDVVWDHILLLKNLHSFSFTMSDSNLPLSRICQLTSLCHLLQLQLTFGTSCGIWAADTSSMYENGQHQLGFQKLEVLRLSGPELVINPIIDLVARRLPHNTLRTLDIVYFPTTFAAVVSIPFSLFPCSLRRLELSALRCSNTPPINPLPNAINPEMPPLAPANITLPTYTNIDSIGWKALGLLGMMGSIKFRGLRILTKPKDLLRFVDGMSPPLPYLHTLNLPCSSRMNTLTLHTLATLAYKLPHLKNLSLYVDLTGYDATYIQLFVDKYEGRSGFGHALEHLFIDNSDEMVAADVCAAVLVGQFIDMLFPSLKKVGLFQEDTVRTSTSVVGAKAKSVNVNWWRGVFKLTQVFQQNRSKTRPEICMD